MRVVINIEPTGRPCKEPRHSQLRPEYQEIWSYKGGYVVLGSGCRAYVSETPETSKRTVKHPGRVQSRLLVMTTLVGQRLAADGHQDIGYRSIICSRSTAIAGPCPPACPPSTGHVLVPRYITRYAITGNHFVYKQHTHPHTSAHHSYMLYTHTHAHTHTHPQFLALSHSTAS